MSLRITPEKATIIEIFNTNVKGKRSNTGYSNSDHDGSEGHWLEKQMGIQPNASNKPDLLGFEMKNATSTKTTFGDWSPDHAIFKRPNASISRDQFLEYFGKPNLEKGGRRSWSGEPIPKINTYSTFGQILQVDNEQNIVISYSYSHDKRPEKAYIMPLSLQVENLVLAKWDRDSIKQKLERKFNANGWFKCEKDHTGMYVTIAFGAPINYENWIELVKKGIVFFDSGMYEGNDRPYAQWRANNDFWESLIIERY